MQCKCAWVRCTVAPPDVFFQFVEHAGERGCSGTSRLGIPATPTYCGEWHVIQRYRILHRGSSSSSSSNSSSSSYVGRLCTLQNTCDKLRCSASWPATTHPSTCGWRVGKPPRGCHSTFATDLPLQERGTRAKPMSKPTVAHALCPNRRL